MGRAGDSRLPWARPSRLLAVALGLAILAGCAKRPAPIYERSANPYRRSAETSTRIQRPSQVVVRAGDTLYSLAWRYGLDYRTLGRWNGIGPPYTIFVGETLVLEAPRELPPVRGGGGVRTTALPERPRATPEPAARPPARTAAAPAPPAAAAPARTPPPKPAAAATADSGGLRWQWPADGAVIAGFSAADASRKGLDIAGADGDPVRAAAAGEVVYSGSGLVGYGELIIIKHSDAYLSAYGHNRRRLVEEGERVTGGQTIAEMGSSGADRPMLHFEIRHNGDPRDPARFLPRR